MLADLLMGARLLYLLGQVSCWISEGESPFRDQPIQGSSSGGVNQFFSLGGTHTLAPRPQDPTPGSSCEILIVSFGVRCTAGGVRVSFISCTDLGKRGLMYVFTRKAE